MTDYSAYTTDELKELLADIISQQEDLPQHSTYAGECLQRERWEVEGELNSRVEKIYKVTEITFAESSSYYFCKKENAKKYVEKVVSENERAGRTQANYFNYDKASDRNKFSAVIDELSWDEYTAEIDNCLFVGPFENTYQSFIEDWEG